MFRRCTEADLPAVQQLVNQMYEEDPNTQDVKADVRLTFFEFREKT